MPDIQNFVGYLINDVIKMYGLELKLDKKVSLKAVYPDLLVLNSAREGIPLGEF